MPPTEDSLLELFIMVSFLWENLTVNCSSEHFQVSISMKKEDKIDLRF